MDGLVKKRVDSNGAIKMAEEGPEFVPMVKKEVDEEDLVVLERDEGPEPELMIYTIDQTPHWLSAILLGLQHFIIMFVSQVAAATIIAEIVGMRDMMLRGQLLSTILTVAAVATLLQTTFGNRLPIVQGSSGSYFMPLIALSSMSKWDCSGDILSTDSRHGGNLTVPAPVNTLPSNVTSDPVCDERQLWRLKITEAQGALIGASLVNMFIGYSGILGLILPYVRPLTVGIVITLLGVPLTSLGAELAGKCWPIGITTIVVASLCGQYLNRIQVPVPTFSLERRRFEVKRTAVFGTYPALIALLFMWILCAVLTAAGALEGEETWKTSVRTDRGKEALANSSWVGFPLPFQWGTPVLTASGVFGMLSGTFASTFESIGDYYACARLSGAPKPPVHAMNRGIGTEGFGNLLCGIWGCGIGTTSYSINIGVIAMTRMGSRRIVQFAGLWMVLFGLITKIGALFAGIPQPVIGGIFLYLMGFLIAAGLSELQFVNLSRTRNLYILGICVTMGLSVPQWIAAHPNAISTGYAGVDQVLTVLLRSTMLVGGLLSIFLDNTIHDPDRQVKQKAATELNEDLSTYQFPVGMGFLRKLGFPRFIPCCPTFREHKRSNSRFTETDTVKLN